MGTWFPLMGSKGPLVVIERIGTLLRNSFLFLNCRVFLTSCSHLILMPNGEQTKGKESCDPWSQAQHTQLHFKTLVTSATYFKDHMLWSISNPLKLWGGLFINWFICNQQAGWKHHPENCLPMPTGKMCNGVPAAQYRWYVLLIWHLLLLNDI